MSLSAPRPAMAPRPKKDIKDATGTGNSGAGPLMSRQAPSARDEAREDPTPIKQKAYSFRADVARMEELDRLAAGMHITRSAAINLALSYFLTQVKDGKVFTGYDPLED